jgi:hypothetical protein
MTHTFEAATPSRDANALLALTVVLILTTWSFFGRFSVVAAAAGIATGLWLHWWYLRPPPSTSAATPPAGVRCRLRRDLHDEPATAALVRRGVGAPGRPLRFRRDRLAPDALGLD